MTVASRWLVARPMHGVLGLLMTAALPFIGFLSSVILVLLILHAGFRQAILQTAAVAVLLALAAALGGNPPEVVVTAMATNWIPGLLLALLLRSSRSLTLTVQLSVILSVLGMALFFVSVNDPVEFWKTLLTTLAEVWRENGLQQQADLVGGRLTEVAEHMTVVAVLSFWLVHITSFLLGYGLFQHLPGQAGRYGRFVDLDLGRVIAWSMAITSLAAWGLGVIWLQNIAFVLFAVFMLQGISLTHWLRSGGKIPAIVIVLMYVSLPFLHIYLISVLAVAGYSDAWFNFRRRVKA